MENIKNVNNELEMYEMIYYGYVNSIEEAKNKFANGADLYELKLGDGRVIKYTTFESFMLDYNKISNTYNKLNNYENTNKESFDLNKSIYYSYVNSVEDAKNKFANGATSYTLNIKMQDGSVSSRVYNTLPEFMLDYNKYMNSYANVKQSFEEKNRRK